MLYPPSPAKSKNWPCFSSSFTVGVFFFNCLSFGLSRRLSCLRSYIAVGQVLIVDSDRTFFGIFGICV